MNALFVPSGAEFLSIAVILNISKWVYFTLYVRALVEENNEDWDEKLERQKKNLNIVTVSVSAVILTISVVYYCKGCIPSYVDGNQ